MLKFKLSTLLLVTAIVALSIGWWLDRTRLEFNAAEVRETEMVRAQVLAAQYLYNPPSADDKEHRNVYVDAVWVKAVLRLAENEASYNQSFAGEDMEAFLTSEDMGQGFLSSLNCESVEGFRDKAKEVLDETEVMLCGMMDLATMYPQLYDSTSDKAVVLDDFLNRSINFQYDVSN